MASQRASILGGGRPGGPSAGRQRPAGRRLLLTLYAAAALAPLAAAYPELWDGYAAGTCAHPSLTTYAGHEGDIVTNAQATFVLKESAGGAVVTQVCPGAKYNVEVSLPQIAGQPPHSHLTSSIGAFDAVAGDRVSRCTDGGAKRSTAFAATIFTTALTVCSVGTATSLKLAITYAVRGGAFQLATLNVPINAACGTDAACAATPPPSSPPASPSPPPSPSPSPKPCTSPCSCAFGIDFEESLCGYANTTLDVKAVQELMSAGAPDFSAALEIYSKGKYAFRDDGVTKRTMLGVTRRNYGEEAYYRDCASYFKKEFPIDDEIGAALRGDGDYASACCGVRAAVVKAASRWFSAVYSMHEVDAGVCYATGCNNRTINFAVAAEEALHGMALMSGADPANGGAGTDNPVNLFQSTNAASRFYCTMKKKDELSPINSYSMEAWKAASAAAKAGDLTQLKTHYGTLEKGLVARFLQYSLEEAREAARPATRRAVNAADACRSSCLRESQQAAARTYFKAVEPIIARTSADIVSQINTLLTGAPRKSYKPLVKQYQAVASALQLDAKTMLLKCKSS